MKTTNIIIRVTPEYKKELKKVALEKDMSLSALILKSVDKEVKSNDEK